MSATTKDKLEFALILGRYTTATLGDVNRLLRYGAALKAIAERQCNGYQRQDGALGWREDTDAADWDERKRERIQAKVALMCSDIRTTAGIKSGTGGGELLWVAFGNDPRGATLKLKVPGYGGNSFDSKGYLCVPTS